MKILSLCILGCLYIYAAHAAAQVRVILLGGGAGPSSSELSVEKNVAWVSGLLRQNGINDFDVQFASGSKGNQDVKERDKNKPDIDKWLPIARVLSSKSSLITVYRKNTVANLEQANTRDSVIDLLKLRLKGLEAGDDLLVVYHGHGGYSPGNTNKNYLRLWADTKLPMNDLLEVFTAQPDKTTLRFIFPQCYSGSFVKLIHDSPDEFSTETVNPQRCGIVTVQDNRQSEGCTVEDDESKYVDFSTYFFAALSGQTRLGQPLEWNPDANKDGKVDFREAYFYAISTAYSRDVPSTTSEYFLELWEPWYIRWLPFDMSDADGEYKKVAKQIAARLGISRQPDEDGFIADVRKKQSDAKTNYDDLNKRLAALRSDEKQLREKLKTEIYTRWPDSSDAFSDNYLRFIEQDLGRVNVWLLSQDRYNELVVLQDKIEALEDEWLNAEREVGMNMRLQRVIYMAKLRRAFGRFGSEEDRVKYSALVSCESWSGLTGN